MTPTGSRTGRAGRAPALICAHCGHQFEAATWQPRLRCPQCHTLGYPDRAGRYLLPVGWECAACGAANDGLANFCTHCGAGLASRCLRCETPVYSAVCPACGTHQARAQHLEAAAARREKAALLPGERPPDSPAVAGWRPLARPVTRQWLHNRALRRWAWRAGVLLALVVGIAVGREVLAGIASSIAACLAGWLGVAWAQLGGLLSWWQAFRASLAHLPGPSEPEYAYLFATVIFQIALLPVLIYLLGRVIRRLLP